MSVTHFIGGPRGLATSIAYRKIYAPLIGVPLSMLFPFSDFLLWEIKRKTFHYRKRKVRDISER